MTVRPGLAGYQSGPSHGGPGVLVVHDWYGLLPGVEAACDALAAGGFVALAPDLYDGQSTVDPGQAEELMNSLDVGQARERLALATTHLRGRRKVTQDKVGAVAFSMGGSLTLAYAATGELDAVVAYYATIAPSKETPIRCPVLLHLAEDDEFDPAERPEVLMAALHDAGTEADARTWPGTEHSFANPDAAAYQPAAAGSAWADTVAFLGRHLRA